MGNHRPVRGNVQPAAYRVTVFLFAMGCLSAAMLAASDFLDGAMVGGTLRVMLGLLIAAIGVRYLRRSRSSDSH